MYWIRDRIVHKHEFDDHKARTGKRGNMLLISLLTVLALSSAAVAGDRPDTPESRIEAAKTYIQLVPVERMSGNVARNVLLLIPEEKRELFRQGVSEGLAKANIGNIMVKIVAKHFNTAEIDAMTVFYGSPEGLAIQRKLPGYTADISLHVIPIIRKSVTEVMEKHFE